jgi:hypothetical protein
MTAPGYGEEGAEQESDSRDSGKQVPEASKEGGSLHQRRHFRFLKPHTAHALRPKAVDLACVPQLCLQV